MGAGLCGFRPLAFLTFRHKVGGRCCRMVPRVYLGPRNKHNTTMSDTKNNGGPAFPLMDSWWKGHDGAYYAGHSEGMTLRDYFAAKAIQGIVSAKMTYEGVAGFSDSDAEQCYIIADAMLKAREQ